MSGQNANNDMRFGVAKLYKSKNAILIYHGQQKPLLLPPPG